MKPFDKEEMGRLIAAIHSLSKDKVRELALLMWRHIHEIEAGNSPELPDGWIPCAERMPEKRGHYLVCTESGLVARSSYSPEHTDYDDVRGCHKLARKDFGKYSRHFEYARASVSKITHWMALPAPPTTEK